jgi:hypothetical protein
VIVAILAMAVLADVRPSAPVDYLPNARRINSELTGQRGKPIDPASWHIPTADGDNCRFVELSKNMLASVGHGRNAVPDSVCHIHLPGIPSQICDTVIVGNAVIVAGLHAGRARAGERRQYEPVNCTKLECAVTVGQFDDEMPALMPVRATGFPLFAFGPANPQAAKHSPVIADGIPRVAVDHPAFSVADSKFSGALVDSHTWIPNDGRAIHHHYTEPTPHSDARPFLERTGDPSREPVARVQPAPVSWPVTYWRPQPCGPLG